MTTKSPFPVTIPPLAVQLLQPLILGFTPSISVPSQAARAAPGP